LSDAKKILRRDDKNLLEFLLRKQEPDSRAPRNQPKQRKETLMAGTVPHITPGSITGMAGKSNRPVFFVRMHNAATPNIVIKGDALKTNSDVSIKWSSKLMKNVQNNLVNSKIMSPAEIAVFKQFATAAFGPATAQYAFTAMPCCWIKMPFVPGLSDADIIDDDTSNLDLQKAKDTIVKLSDSDVWQQLGRIVAVDVFNGNSDRFVVDGPTAGAWQNMGNIMFLGAGHGHATSVIGLDTFDPFSTNSDLHSGGGYENMKVLIDPVKRDAFARKCAIGVGTKLKYHIGRFGHTTVDILAQGHGGPAMLSIPIATMDNLFVAYVQDFSQGLAQGAADLRTMLNRKVLQYSGAVAPNRPLSVPGSGAPVRPSGPMPGLAPARPNSAIPGSAPARPFAHVPGTAPHRPTAAAPMKTVPQGILDRMAYLGW